MVLCLCAKGSSENEAAHAASFFFARRVGWKLPLPLTIQHAKIALCCERSTRRSPDRWNLEKNLSLFRKAAARKLGQSYAAAIMTFTIIRADNEWRYDPVDGAWSLVARNRRTLPPLAVRRTSEEEALRHGAPCPFCDLPALPNPSREPEKSERTHEDVASTEEVVPAPYVHRALDQLDRGAWQMVAIPSPTPLCFVEHEAPPQSPFVSEGALGAHELLLPLGPKAHQMTLPRWDSDGISGLFTLLSRRCADLREDQRLQSITMSCLPSAWSRLSHFHASVLATPFPGRASQNESLCPVCEDVKAAQATGRVLTENDAYIAYIPYAPRHTLHIRIVAAQHGGSETFASMEQLESNAASTAVAELVLKSSRALEALVPSLPLQLTVPAIPLSTENHGAHLLLELTSPIQNDTMLAEGLGTRIISLPPEDLVQELKGVVDRS